MTDAVEAQASLEAVLKDEIIRMYEDVAANTGRRLPLLPR
ncbi:MAG: hypothetical protein BMS9Abin29_2182 [Gemmatimonadota bacterium]|nr:MAG: hypothetical protein BMS9Abin29_2182 [Gemmatimonadota bacterium]